MQKEKKNYMHDWGMTIFGIIFEEYGSYRKYQLVKVLIIGYAHNNEVEV